jgi:predicted TIM-barrel enzyme
MGVNFLAVTGKIAFPELANLESDKIRIDAYWADDARIDERWSANDQVEAEEILRVKSDCGWNGMYFGGTAFKKQRDVNPDDYERAASIACDFMDVVTTSGIATGHSADLGKISTFRAACGDMPLALASGITPENVSQYLRDVDCVLVATGINVKDDFYNIDPKRLGKLMQQIEAGENS